MAESISTLIPLEPHHARKHDRTHLFVAAALCSGEGACPVHIRNMSPSGALLEGIGLPELDTPVTLRRGKLQVAARIVWLVGRKAGVAFCAPIQVIDWMPRSPSAHQARVDDIVRGIRSGAACPETAPDPPSPTLVDPLAEGELRALKEELIALETGLAGDAQMIATHPEIQLLDIALQRIERLLAGANRS